MARPIARPPGAVRILPVFASLLSAATLLACEAEGDLAEESFEEALPDEVDEDAAHDLVDGAVFDHGYEDVLADVGISWVNTAAEPTVSLENRTSEAIAGAAFVDVRGLGLDDVRQDLGVIDLPPGETVQLAVEAAKLPLRASEGSVWVEIGFEMDHEGQPIEFRTSRGRLDFDGDQQPTHFDASPPAPRSVEEALEQTTLMSFGKGTTTQGGTQLNVANDPDDPRGPITFPDFNPLPPLPPIPPLPSTSRVCPTWRVHYVDPNSGQDYMNASGVQHVPASFAHVTITTPPQFFPYYTPGTQVYSGYLDEDGCTPQLNLSGNYIFSLTTKHKDGPLEVEVKNNSVADQFGYANGSFTATTFGAAVYPTTGEDTRHTRSAAIISRALATDDLPVSAPGNKLEVFADQNCPGAGNYAACSSGTRLYIGQNAYGDDMSLRRHIVAHEFGHNISRFGMGNPFMSYGGGDAPLSQPLCRCDHVTFANQAHCLQSRETIEVAFTEGFAHFVGTKLFNDQEESSCRFSYYKEFLTTSNTVKSPPVSVNCASPVQWMESRGCAAPNHGTEYDWMNFLWVLNSSDTLSMPEFFDVMRAACSPSGGGCGGGSFDYVDLEAAVQNSSALTSSQKAGFDFVAAVYGIDN